eukprot:2901192-Rhodomonas_salina.1
MLCRPKPSTLSLALFTAGLPTLHPYSPPTFHPYSPPLPPHSRPAVLAVMALSFVSRPSTRHPVQVLALDPSSAPSHNIQSYLLCLFRTLTIAPLPFRTLTIAPLPFPTLNSSCPSSSDARQAYYRSSVPSLSLHITLAHNQLSTLDPSSPGLRKHPSPFVLGEENIAQECRPPGSPSDHYYSSCALNVTSYIWGSCHCQCQCGSQLLELLSLVGSVALSSCFQVAAAAAAQCCCYSHSH